MVSCVTSSCLWAQTAGSLPNDTNKSWTATTERVSVDLLPSRTTETHMQAGNRTVDTQSVEQLGLEGHFEPYLDIEKESIQVSATTVRTVVRTFDRDGVGRKTLTQVTEETTESQPRGGEKIVRTVSIPDQDGHLPIVRREVTDIQRTGPDVQVTNTAVFVSDGSGGLAPGMQIRERQTRTSDQTTSVQKTTLLLDGGDNWQVHELKERTITDNGKDRTTEERVSQPEYLGGKLSVVSDSIAKESETGPGERQASDETYSTDIPGSGPDGKLHLSQRVTTVSEPHADGRQVTQQQLEQLDPGGPDAGLQEMARTVEIVSTDGSGKLQTRTVRARDGGGNLRVTFVETRTQAVKVDTAPAR